MIEKIVELLAKLKNSKHLDLYKKTKHIRDCNQKLFWDREKLSKIINQRILEFFNLYDKQ